MAEEDKLEGARNAFVFFYAFQDAVGKEIGMEKAVALAGEVDEALGAAQGKLMKAQAGLGEIDVKAATAMALNAIKEGFCITAEVVEESPQKTAFRCGRCPIYEAGQMMGMDAETIENQCRMGPFKYMDAMVKQLNPKLSYQLKTFRSSAGAQCEEMIEMS